MFPNKVIIHPTTRNNIPYLQFDFVGRFDDKTAEKAIKEWKEQMKVLCAGGKKINLIYNCVKMTGFSTAGRRNWQHTMSELKDQINKIWIVSDNIFILSAAKMMGALVGFKIITVRTLGEIK